MSVWIAVEDRTPPIGDVVLLMVSGALSYGWLAWEGQGGLFFNWRAIIEGQIQENPARVTHWQPLPEPPVTDEERSAALDELLSGKFADDA